jgi:hypothetical protein
MFDPKTLTEGHRSAAAAARHRPGSTFDPKTLTVGHRCAVAVDLGARSIRKR